MILTQVDTRRDCGPSGISSLALRGMAVVAEARDWERQKTRFQHQARLKGVATDCVGLVLGVAFNAGVPNAAAAIHDPACGNYARSPDPATLLMLCEKYLDRIAVSRIQPGDVLMMRFEDEPQHFAIVTAVDPLAIVHAHATVRRVVEHRVDALWRSRLVGAWRFRYE